MRCLITRCWRSVISGRTGRGKKGRKASLELFFQEPNLPHFSEARKPSLHLDIVFPVVSVLTQCFLVVQPSPNKLPSPSPATRLVLRIILQITVKLKLILFSSSMDRAFPVRWIHPASICCRNSPSKSRALCRQ